MSPDNVHETGVSPGGQSRSPIVAAEAQQVEPTRTKSCSRARSEVCALQGPFSRLDMRLHEWIHRRFPAVHAIPGMRHRLDARLQVATTVMFGSSSSLPEWLS